MLTKDKSDIWKGIAAILMLAHHLFGFPGWVITSLIIGFCVKEPMPNLAEFMKNLVGIDTAVFEYGTGYICVGMA